VLIVPPNATIVFGSNPVNLGDINPGGSRTANWVLVFSSSGIFDLGVTASGYRADNGYREETYGETTLTVHTRLIVSVFSPQNITYPDDDVPLTFTLNKAAAWIGYSLDGQANVTITGNTTINDLSDGSHSVEIYANDTIGNMESKKVFLTVDTTPPLASVLSPHETVYNDNKVPLTFTLNEPAAWIGYSLDGQTNVTITGNTTLTGLTDGSHHVIMFANDTLGNIGASDTINFTVQDTTTPNILVLSPENKTYSTTNVSLMFTVDEPVLWMAYSLDGQLNTTILGNTTISDLSEGSHEIFVFATDVAGNTGSSNQQFSFELKHDLTVIAVTPLETGCVPPTVVGQGYSVNIYVTVENLGSFTETVNTTIIANMTIINTSTIVLGSGESMIVTFTWNTTGWTKGNYTVSAYTWPVPGETDVNNNNFTGCHILVTVAGDVDGDGSVDIFDIVRMTAAYGSEDGELRYVSNCDIDRDRDIDIFDLVIACGNFGES